MTGRTESRPPTGDPFTEAGTILVALGILTMVLAPFALPGIALTVAAIVPLVLLGAVATLLVALAAAPVLLVRRLRRRATTDEV